MSGSVRTASFSALQRAENSSILSQLRITLTYSSFSALQRAENSSIPKMTASADCTSAFQCSSASRKFLNWRQRKASTYSPRVSVLFSEPKIPQLRRQATGTTRSATVSVLFSEPKIPQFVDVEIWQTDVGLWFQCSSASRKFLNSLSPSSASRTDAVSVLFSEPKIPQLSLVLSSVQPQRGFSALQRAENSSIVMTNLSSWTRFLRFSALQRAENSSIITH